MSIESITSQALDHHRKGDYDTALKLHLQALSLLEETVGKSHADTADRYRKLGSVMDDAGFFDKAKEYFEQALSIWEQVGDTEESKLCRGELNEIVGNLLYKTEDYEGAHQKFQQAKEIFEATPGVDNKTKLEEIEYLMEVASMMMG
jgi:tetratricopeptide (TPR) repeat protein